MLVSQIKSEQDPDKLLNLAVKSIMELGPIKMNSVVINELIYEMPIKAEFKEISPYISFNKCNGIFEITVPTFDERKLPEFQIQLFQKKVNDCFPERGFFITGSSSLIIRPLGLIKVEMYGLPIIRVGKDIRYIQTSNDIKGRGYREYLYFYYDYEKKEYYRVYPDKLEECKRKMEFNPDVITEYHESVQEYIKREKLLDEIIKKIYKLTIHYLPKLQSWLKFEYGDGGLTIGSLETYLKQYKQFLQVTMDKSLKVKLVYSNITRREFTEIMNKKKELISLIDKSFKKLDRLKEINFLTEESYKKHILDKTNSFSEEEITIIDLINNEVLGLLQKFKEVRPSEFPTTTLNEEKILKGYIGYDLRTNEVFPNIMQLQRRTSLTEEKEDFRSEADYISRIIDELKSLKTVELI